MMSSHKGIYMVSVLDIQISGTSIGSLPKSARAGTFTPRCVVHAFECILNANISRIYYLFSISLTKGIVDSGTQDSYCPSAISSQFASTWRAVLNPQLKRIIGNFNAAV